jgi:hypothetical protein
MHGISFNYGASLTFRAESAHDIDNQAYQQNQANPAAANEGTTKVKPTTTEQ